MKSCQISIVLAMLAHSLVEAKSKLFGDYISECQAEPDLRNLVHTAGLWKSPDKSKEIGVDWVDPRSHELVWPPYLQVYKSFEGKMRIDFYSDGEVSGEDIVTTSYYVHYLADGQRDITSQKIFFEPEMKST